MTHDDICAANLRDHMRDTGGAPASIPAMKSSPKVGVRVAKVTRQMRDHWVARWEDPTGSKTSAGKRKTCQCTIPAEFAGTKKNRERFCAIKSEELSKIKAATSSSRGPINMTTIAKLGDDWMTLHLKKENSRKTRRSRINAFAEWCTERRITNTGELRPDDVLAWSDYCKHPDRISARSGQPWKKTTQNDYIKTITSMLKWGTKRRYCPLLTREEIRGGTELAKEPKHVKDYLRTGHGMKDAPNEIRDMLEAWLNDDTSYGGAGTCHVGLAMLLTGCRKAEILGDPDNDTGPMTWREVKFDRACIELDAERIKTETGREIHFRETPLLGELLRALHPQRTSDDAAVFEGITIPMLDLAVKRVRNKTKRHFTAQLLRRTCGMILVNAPTIYSMPGMPAGASIWLATQRLGHTVGVAEKHYLKQRVELPTDASTFEAASGIETVARTIINRVATTRMKEAS